METRIRFPVDHFVPRALRPDLAHEYTNLLYVCTNCNTLKGRSLIPDPCTIPLGRCIVVRLDGTVEPLNKEGLRLVYELALDDPTLIEYRRRMIRTLRVCAEQDWPEFVAWMRFPDDLPDLASDPPPYNLKSTGVLGSWFARRGRGELPEVY